MREGTSGWTGRGYTDEWLDAVLPTSFTKGKFFAVRRQGE